jgi:hypothetical protein
MLAAASILCGSCFEKKNVWNKFSPRGLFGFVIISLIVNYIPDTLRGHLHQLMAIIYTMKKCVTGPQIAVSTCTAPNPIRSLLSQARISAPGFDTMVTAHMARH